MRLHDKAFNFTVVASALLSAGILKASFTFAPCPEISLWELYLL